MSDLIDRQAAIDALRYSQHRFTVADEAGGMGTVKWSEDVIYFAAAERVLSELPPAQPSVSKTEIVGDVISRQAAIDALMEILDRPNHAEFLYTDEICKALKALPSAQPEIIRCKDCRFNDGVAYCEMHYRDVKGNDFCSWAERRQDG